MAWRDSGPLQGGVRARSCGKGQRQIGREEPGGSGGDAAAVELSSFSLSECRDVLLPLLIDQLSGQLDDNSSRPDPEASSQLLSNILEVLDRKDVVSELSLMQTTACTALVPLPGTRMPPWPPGLRAWPRQFRSWCWGRLHHFRGDRRGFSLLEPAVHM